MKKDYIKPQAKIVVINLIGSVLQGPTAEMGKASEIAISMYSRESDDRFEDYDDEEWDWE